MTIALALKVNDGLVLAADSASSMVTQDEKGNALIANVYNNANKVFNLRKGYPIGGVTWGLGNIGQASISTLVKDLRRRFSGQDPNHIAMDLETGDWTVQSVAQDFYSFIYDEQYVLAFKNSSAKSSVGFFIAGYSPGEGMAELYEIQIQNGQCKGPQLVMTRELTGVLWRGQPEAICRMVNGFSGDLPRVLRENLGLPEEQVPVAINVLQQALGAQLVVPSMPFQDAIDLTAWLADLTVQYSRFMPGPPTVGGPIEIAGISKHEGFKWITRKYYYDRALNPEGSEENLPWSPR